MASKFDLFRGEFIALGFRPVGGFEHRAIRPAHVNKAMEWLIPIGAIDSLSAPLSSPELHRTFSQLGTARAITNFASTWGFLGVSTPTIWDEEPRGEPLDYWLQEIKEMRGLVELWDLVVAARRRKRTAHDELQTRVIWGADSVASIVVHAGAEPRTVGKEWRSKDRAQIVDDYVRSAVGQKLQGSAPAGSIPDGCTCKECLMHYPFAQHPRLEVVLMAEAPMLLATSLLVALYALFASDLYGYANIRCIICTKKFTSKRRDAKTCSDACRAVRNRRDRKNRKALAAMALVASNL
jgi:predicted nucleic acid-binding Zn ribbon protein